MLIFSVTLRSKLKIPDDLLTWRTHALKFFCSVKKGDGRWNDHGSARNRLLRSWRSTRRVYLPRSFAPAKHNASGYHLLKAAFRVWWHGMSDARKKLSRLTMTNADWSSCPLGLRSAMSGNSKKQSPPESGDCLLFRRQTHLVIKPMNILLVPPHRQTSIPVVT